MVVATGTALAITAATTAASAAISASAKNKAGKRTAAAANNAAEARDAAFNDVLAAGLLDAPEEVQFDRITDPEVRSAARRAQEVTTAAGPGLNELASSFNEQNVKDLQAGLDALSGGRGKELTEGAFGAVVDQLEGRLSQGARQVLARQALNSGIAELGQGAVDRAFGGFLGITAEQQANAGIQNLRGLSSLAAPVTNASNLLAFGGLTTNAALQIEQFNSQGQFNADSLNTGREFTARTNQANAILGNADATINTRLAGEQAQINASSQATQQLASGLGSAVGGLAGGFAQANALSNTGTAFATQNALSSQAAGNPASTAIPVSGPNGFSLQSQGSLTGGAPGLTGVPTSGTFAGQQRSFLDMLRFSQAQQGQSFFN